MVALAVQDAAKNGDRSENGDYIYGKKRLREIDSRVRFLTKRLEVLQVVSERPADIERVFFGATVTIKETDDGGDGQVQTLTILGPDEFDSAQNQVSIDAPMARALLGKSVGDRVRVTSPRGERDFEVLEISYP